MTTKAHKLLTGTDLHENKGAASASDDNVATATSGATVWKKLTAINLTGTGNPFGAQLLHVKDEKTSGTQGGGFTSGAWQTRTLQTTKTNEIGASLGSNQITLLAGTYYLEATFAANGCSYNQLRLRNITDGSTTLVGITSDPQTQAGGLAVIDGRFTIGGTKVFELQHRCASTQATNGFGTANSFGEVECYGSVKIWKVL